MHLIGRVLVVVLAGCIAACAARGGVPRPFPGAPLPPGASENGSAKDQPDGREGRSEDRPLPVESRRALVPVFPDVVATALGYRGVPYRNGGSDPSGFDCSGFVQYVFKQAGAALPREVREQFHTGQEIDREAVQAGDLVFFETVARGASHVGLAIGGGEFVHAPSSNGVVRIERLTSSYWTKRYVGARRVR